MKEGMKGGGESNKINPLLSSLAGDTSTTPSSSFFEGPISTRVSFDSIQTF